MSFFFNFTNKKSLSHYSDHFSSVEVGIRYYENRGIRNSSYLNSKYLLFVHHGNQKRDRIATQEYL